MIKINKKNNIFDIFSTRLSILSSQAIEPIKFFIKSNKGGVKIAANKTKTNKNI
ncbi:hypothetical protein BGM30_06980 [Microcystis aeruginosa NIES-298]|uniref:Uncharacterized protein n=1 Tax=Microcystis aeruginosa NIES-298 TaxID=449468 RepID=A0A9P2YGB8_MICAE|nr:hypothetical protein BGM30_06980 [Microcystis aeruginosa NIES-298]